MTFASWDFLMWLLAALILYHVLPARLRPLLLLLYSIGFYLTWSVAHTLLLLGVTTSTWLTAILMERSRQEGKRRALLLAGLCAPLGLLLFFKSLGPLDRMLHGLALGGFDSDAIRLRDLLVPIGISFYSFKLMSYLLDVYWERADAETSFVVFGAHVFFFPQILCGPIQRAGDFAEQMRQRSPIAGRIVLEGMALVALGFLKKLLADPLSVPVRAVFDNPHAYPGMATWGAAYLFTLQLYLDFSGYSDIAVGLGKLFGIECERNFAGPLFAGNIQVFWKRWHITLTSWMRDYVFTPCNIALRRWGRAGLVVSIGVNMALIGLWHDLRWPFLVFGLMHAGFLIIYVLTPHWRAQLAAQAPGWTFWSWLITLHAVVLAFMVFRAPDLRTALTLAANLGRRPIQPLPIGWITAVPAVLLALVCHLGEIGKLRLPRSELLYYGFLAVAMIALFVFSSVENVSFLYQKF